MYVTTSKIFSATQFWVEEETWPEGVYSNEEATPAYFIDMDEVATSIVDGDWVLRDNDDTISLVTTSNFIATYTEVGE